MGEGNLAKGRAGEEAAVRFLKRRGYRILERNFRTPFGELDIVALKGRDLAFCEVKSRTGGDLEEVLSAVNEKKRERMAKAAAYYLLREGIEGRRCRFDVIALLNGRDGWKIMHVRDAFEVGDC
ncbi:YraN family protein [Candidatus Solincola sp.]|nr:YraN family protein [Actinomycetota bacterium]